MEIRGNPLSATVVLIREIQGQCVSEALKFTRRDSGVDLRDILYDCAIEGSWASIWRMFYAANASRRGVVSVCSGWHSISTGRVDCRSESCRHEADLTSR